jgi:hypothetical protein
MAKTTQSPKVKKTRRKRSKLRVAGIGLETAGLGALGAGYYSHKKGMAAAGEAGRMIHKTPMDWHGKQFNWDSVGHNRRAAIQSKRMQAIKHVELGSRLGKAGLVSGLTGLGASALAGIYGFRKKRQQAKK